MLTQGKHLEMERGPAPQEVGQGGEQRNKYRFHTGNATWAPTEKLTKSMSTEFLVKTGRKLNTPLSYTREGNIVRLLSDQSTRWWLNFRGDGVNVEMEIARHATQALRYYWKVIARH